MQYVFQRAERKDTVTSGFTLIELLVVISIIGLLSSVVLASLNTARVKSRDTRRMQDLLQIRTALELYHGDYGHYPNSNGAWSAFENQYAPTDIINPNAADLTTALQPYFSGAPPKDPKSLGSDSGYLYLSNGSNSDYCILFWRTPENLNNFKSSFIPVGRCSAWNSAGQCTAGTNAIYYGVGLWTAGC